MDWYLCSFSRVVVFRLLCTWHSDCVDTILIILVTSHVFFYKYLRANGDSEKLLIRQMAADNHGSTTDRSNCSVVDTFTVVTRNAEINCSVKESKVDVLSYLLLR